MTMNDNDITNYDNVNDIKGLIQFCVLAARIKIPSHT